MTPELRRIMGVLAKYKISLPVAAYIELGLFEDSPPTLTKAKPTYKRMSLSEMIECARKRGRVRWRRSGIVERLSLKHDGVATDIRAAGAYTTSHLLEFKGWYDCEPYGNLAAPAPGYVPHHLRKP